MLAAQACANDVGLEAFVAEAPPLPPATELGFDGKEIVGLPVNSSECDSIPITLDDGHQRVVGPAPLRAGGRRSLSIAGIAPSSSVLRCEQSI